MPGRSIESASRFALWCSFDDAFILRYGQPESIKRAMEATLRLAPQAKFRIHREDGTPPATPPVVPAFLAGAGCAELRAAICEGEPEAAA